MYACMRACVVACVSCVCVCVCVCGNVSARHDPTLRTHTRTHMTSARQSPRASVMLPTASQHNPESLNPRDTTAPSCTMHLERNTRHRHPAPALCTRRGDPVTAGAVHGAHRARIVPTSTVFAISALGSRGSGPAYSRTFCVGVATGAAGLDHCPPHGTRAGESAPLAGAPPRPSTTAPVDAQLRTLRKSGQTLNEPLGHLRTGAAASDDDRLS